MKQKTLCSCPLCKNGKCGVCRDALFYRNNTNVIDHGMIKSEQDIMKLNIIDWKRHDPWANPQAAMHTIFSWFNQKAHYTIMDEDLTQCPERDDFPGWEHVGDHEMYGKLYWNWFHYWHKGELLFGDSPDFQGTLNLNNEEYLFYGDFGQCSPVALAHTQKHMRASDLWISILGANRQVIIEPSVDLIDLFGNILPHRQEEITREALVPAIKTHVQLNLF